MSEKLAKMSSLQRENLLINSDFKSGIINQPGYLKYGGTIGYEKGQTIDMWFVKSSNINDTQITINENSVTIKNIGSNDVYFIQELEKIFPSDNYCYFVKVKSVIGTVNAFLTDFSKTTKLVVGNNTVKEIGQIDAFGLQLKSNSEIEIEYIKLEQGLCFTGMPVWDETLQLLKCQRHYMIIKNLKVALRGHTNQVFTSTFILPIRMKKSPTITIEDTASSYGVSNISGWADSNVLQISFKTLNDNMVDCRVNKVVLDAYDH